MWRPPLTFVNFVTLHYVYIISVSLLCFLSIWAGGNISAADALLFGSSAATESGLNPVDVKELMLYQQLAVYFVPMITNIGFINIIVVVVRLLWFRKHLKKMAPALLNARNNRQKRQDGTAISDLEEATLANSAPISHPASEKTPEKPPVPEYEEPKAREEEDFDFDLASDHHADQDNERQDRPMRITFDPAADTRPKNDSTLYIPGPRDRDRGHPLVELHKNQSYGHDSITTADALERTTSGLRRRRTDGAPRMAEAKSIDRVVDVASSIFVIGPEAIRRDRRPSVSSQRPVSLNEMPFLSRQVTVGRNSQFRNLTAQDREDLGGIEYRSLKLLLKIVICYFVGFHLFGVICIVPWIRNAPARYRDYLAECGQNEVWWAIYSAQTMMNNLGLTLTPDSMISFRDSEWIMIIMSFLAFAGNTFYPVFLRLIIWTMYKITPSHSSIREPLSFLLDHPRRCYTLLFPSRPTWILFAILFALNFLDTLLIVVLDLDNPEVNVLPIGQRILAAIFQAASARHTGTATFNLANVSPAVQFSLLVMMYISVFPISISIRSSNTYEEKSLGVYESQPNLEDVDETKGTSYLLTHMRNQLSFDLWYIFLGIFCISIAEASRIMDANEPGIELFPIFFEVTSAYANVGLSLGYPTVATSLSGKLSTFSKVIICLTMIRGRHRGLPYQLDRAIMLPGERLVEDEIDGRGRSRSRGRSQPVE
ncbi:cation transport protein-domain-containing protein [Stachybotrys elegans]|uniref:Potassium transport protein n=1 Tax=Stachybotrys elegans TaxID=80388 RepID=A0A8K0SNG2_9HYPO|nr:cation transport protein-domain-containing protein [Stachybotrys elegans]